MSAENEWAELGRAERAKTYREKFAPRHNWDVIRLARLEEGLTDREISERFDVPMATLKSKAKSEKWPAARAVQNRMELLKKAHDLPSNQDIWPEWIALQHTSVLNNIRRLSERGGLDPETMTDDEIKRYKECLNILKMMEDIALVNAERGRKLRQMELDRNGPAEDSNQLDIAGLCLLFKKTKGNVMEGPGVIDVTTKALAELKEATHGT